MISHILVVSLLAGAGLAAPVQDDAAAQAPLSPSGKLTASIQTNLTEGVEWLVPISIAGKTFNVQLDTGSADLWLFCTEGPSNIESGHNLYDPKTGTKVDGASFDITYGSGYAKGDVYTDKVAIGGITITQSVECATDVDSSDAGDHQLDGVMGMGFNSGSTKVNYGFPQPSSATESALNAVTTKGGGIFGALQSNQPDPQMTPFENAYSQLVSGLFTADLVYKQTGLYNFGYIDQTRFTTPITYMPVRDFNYWVIETSGYQVGSKGAKSQTWKALVDTGTTSILLPSATVDEYFSAVPKAQKQSDGSYHIPCDVATAALPPLTITLTPPQPVASFIQPSSSGGINTMPYNAVVPGEYMIGNPTGNNDGMCQSGLGSQSSGQSWDIILGNVFMMSQLIIFDVADPNGSVDSKYPSHGQIGFAPKPSNSTTSST